MENDDHFINLKEFRSQMERSSRFMSLSGNSGIILGCYALLGVTAVYWYLGIGVTSADYFHLSWDEDGSFNDDFFTFFYLVATAMLICSLITGYYFAAMRSVKRGLRIWDSASKRMAVNLLIPLFTGGVFCIVLIFHGELALIPGSMLIFYGLSLVNTSKYVENDIRYLGMIEIGLGILGLCFPGYGLLFWATGFGILHIVYGIVLPGHRRLY